MRYFLNECVATLWRCSPRESLIENRRWVALIIEDFIESTVRIVQFTNKREYYVCLFNSNPIIWLVSRGFNSNFKIPWNKIRFMSFVCKFTWNYFVHMHEISHVQFYGNTWNLKTGKNDQQSCFDNSSSNLFHFLCKASYWNGWNWALLKYMIKVSVALL